MLLSLLLMLLRLLLLSATSHSFRHPFTNRRVVDHEQHVVAPPACLMQKRTITLGCVQQ